mgnify:CR=1 FL=1
MAGVHGAATVVGGEDAGSRMASSRGRGVVVQGPHSSPFLREAALVMEMEMGGSVVRKSERREMGSSGKRLAARGGERGREAEASLRFGWASMA